MHCALPLLYFLSTYYLTFRVIGPHISAVKSLLLRIAFYFLISQVFFASAIFVLCLVLVPLLKIKLFYVALAAIIFLIPICLYEVRKSAFQPQAILAWFKNNLSDMNLIFAALLAATFFFNKFLVLDGSKIYRAHIYWDFGWHVSAIQSFAEGLNFPPKDPNFSDTFLYHHFMFHFLEAIYNSLGLGLVYSINLVSIVSFSVLIIAISGFCQEFFLKASYGLVAIIFFLTNGSLRPIVEILMDPVKYFNNISKLLTSHFTDPFKAAVFKIELLGYTTSHGGSAYNLFYYVVERRLIFGALFLLLGTVFLYYLETLSRSFVRYAALFCGLFFLWHLYALILFLVAAGFFLLFNVKSVRCREMFLITLMIFLVQALIIKAAVTGNPSFDTRIAKVPRFNFTFMIHSENPTRKAFPSDLVKIIILNCFGYGLRLFTIFYGYRLVFKNNRHLFYLLFALSSGFFLANAVQLSPGSITENHKWYKLTNMIFDIVSAYAFCILFSHANKVKRVLLGFLFVAMTFSGVVELIPYFTNKADILYADSDSELSNWVKDKTQPSDIFISRNAKAIHLFGRKVFSGYAYPSTGLDKGRREKTVQALYSLSSSAKFCEFILSNGITFMEYAGESSFNSKLLLDAGFSYQEFAINKNKVRYFKVKEGCDKLQNQTKPT